MDAFPEVASKVMIEVSLVPGLTSIWRPLEVDDWFHSPKVTLMSLPIEFSRVMDPHPAKKELFWKLAISSMPLGMSPGVVAPESAYQPESPQIPVWAPSHHEEVWAKMVAVQAKRLERSRVERMVG